MSSFRFEDPWAILLAVGLLPLIFFSMRPRRTGSIKYPTLGLLRPLTGPLTTRIHYVPVALRSLALVLVVGALARPQLGNKNTEVLSEGVDIMLAVDTSGTMKALDFIADRKRVTRLEAVKKVVSDFISGRENDRIGMIVFGTHAFLQCPLTLDHGVLLSFLNKAEIGMAGEYTAIGSAIGLGASRLKDLPGKEKVIILLTDGINNRGKISPEMAAEIAKKLGIKIYTIGVGSKGKAPFRVKTILGDRLRYEYVPLDERTLRQVAKKTGGEYFRATDTEALERIYEQIDKMEKTEMRMKEYTEYFELYPWFVFPALGLVAVEFLLKNTALRQIP
ncbi:MAG: VWA domain-containing protein [Candidatus Hydrogenedentota bacterium]|nr:MAG: VWA domain-containing protein [Candidatus Hydrogenedentota bacterium]